MSENLLHRDQENLYGDKQYRLSSTVPLQSSDLQYLEERILQDANLNTQPNGIYSKSQRLSQEGSTTSSVSTQYDKNVNIQTAPKGGDKELRQILRENISPTASGGANDLSYRIVNEILNTQNGNRSQFKLKMSSRIAERRKSPLLTAQTPTENMNEIPSNNILKETKGFFEDNEGLRLIENKITEVQKKIENKKTTIEAARKKQKEDTLKRMNNIVRQAESRIKGEQGRIRERLSAMSQAKNASKDKSSLSKAKDKLRQIKSEYQSYEREILRLRDLIEKQDKEKMELEQRTAKPFEKQISEFDDALRSIEDQKVGIYTKLDEAMHSHNENLEQKAMFKEDLSARLLQRADLVAQREDLEQVIENLKSSHPKEIEFYQAERELNEQIKLLTSSLDDLSAKRQTLLNRRDSYHPERRTSLPEISVGEWREICSVAMALSTNLREVGLPDLEEICRKVIRQWGLNIDKKSIWPQLQETSEAEFYEEAAKDIKMKRKIVREALEIWKTQILEALEGEQEPMEQESVLNDSDFVERVQTAIESSEEEFVALFNELSHKLSNDRGGRGTAHDIQNNPELRKLEQEIHDKEAKKRDLETELYRKQEVMGNSLMNEADVAFEAYMQQQASTFESISMQYGEDAAEDMKHQNRKEFIEITQQNVMDQIRHYMTLKRDLQYLEQTIKNNTDTVDKNVLPSLQTLLTSIEEGSVLLTALKKQQMLLLETEDEVSGQFNYILEQRDDRIKRSQTKYDENAQYSLKELRNAKRTLEKKIEPIAAEISKLENHIIEADKHATEGIFEQRRLQKEFEDVNKEFKQIGVMQRPSLQSNGLQIEVHDKELRELQKNLEHLEMQKLTLEQQFIEQNYLTEDLPTHNITPIAGLTQERLLKASNGDTKGNRPASSNKEQTRANAFVDKENYGRADRRLHNMKIQGITDIGGPSDENLDLSPIGRGSQSPEVNPKQDLLNELNGFSHQGPLSNKAAGSAWNCFSPIGSALSLGGSFKGKGKISSSKKDKSRDRGEDSQKDEVSYLKNYQKRLGQKQTSTGSNLNIRTAAPGVSLDTRTRSLPQTVHHSLKKPEHFDFSGQLRSPKDNELYGKYPNVYQARELQSAKNLSRSQNNQGMNMYKKHNLAESAKNIDSSLKKYSGEVTLDENINIFSPKALSLHINNLKAQTSFRNGLQVPQSLRSATGEQSRLKDFLGYHEYLSGKKVAAGSFVEPKPKIKEGEELRDIADDKNTRPRKSLSLETSSHFEEQASLRGLQKRPDMSNRGTKGINNFSSPKQETSQEPIELTTRRAYHNLHGGSSVVKKGQSGEPGLRNYEEESRSKSTELGGRMYSKLNGASSRDIDVYRSNDGYDLSSGIMVSHLGSPIASNYEIRESILDSNGRYNPSNQSLNDSIFLETLKPLLQGSLLYKKFTNNQSLKRAAFDPLLADVNPPEACGYGVRSIRLHPSLDKIEIRHTSKPSVEMVIPIDQILRPVAPQLTMDILRVQRKIVESQNQAGPSEDKLHMAEIFGDLNTKALLAKRGVNSLNNGMERYLNCSYYTFSVHLEKNGKAEFIASSYTSFKEWINGLNMLLKYKKQLPKLRSKLKNYKL